MMKEPRKIGFAIKATTNEFTRFMKGRLGDEEVTGMQYGILNFIFHHKGDIYQKDIEKEFNIRRSTATGILQLMEKNGLIRREEDPHDARLKKIITTQKACQFSKDMKQKISQIEKQLSQGISKDDLYTFFKVLDKISENLNE